MPNPTTKNPHPTHHYIPRENTLPETTFPGYARLEETFIGPWLCTCGDDPNEYIDFLEAHVSTNPEKFVFRVSKFDGGIQLGECVILNSDQILQIRDLLNEFLDSVGR